MLYDIYYTADYSDGLPLLYYQLAADSKDEAIHRARCELGDAVRLVRVEMTDYQLL